MAEFEAYEGSANAYLDEDISSLEFGITSSLSNQNNQVVICCALVTLISLKLSIVFYTKFIKYKRTIRTSSRDSEKLIVRHNAY